MNNKLISNMVFILAAITAMLILVWFFWPAPEKQLVRLVKSPYTFNKTVDNIKAAIASNNFKLVRQKVNINSHTLYFCNFDIAHKAIQEDKRVGVLLPCKIKVIKIKQDTFVATVNVDILLKQTSIDIGSLCSKIKYSIDSILDEATI